ncbi:DinB family protein [Fulvivirga marina]|nr:DinB family protein [Fulvivirga marina]
MIKALLTELEKEAQTTRKMLERIPDAKFQWQPHTKSMTLLNLATHIAELPGWITTTLTTDELDLAEVPYVAPVLNSTEELMTLFEDKLKEGKSQLEEANEERFNDTWILREGNQVYSSDTKAEVLRMVYCQIVHHRAQLGVYLRLLDVPIPGSYGPSADEVSF